MNLQNNRHLKLLSEKLIDVIETANNISPAGWLAAFSAIIAIRIFIEKISQHFPDDSCEYLTIFYLQNFLFFAVTLALLWLWTSYLLKTNPKKLSGLFIMGAWLIILPPIIDMIRTGGKIYWSFYLLNNLGDLWIQYLTIFGHLPPAIVYFGTKITFILVIIILTAYVYLKTKSFFNAAVNVVVSYTIMFFMGSFPSWFSFAYFPLFEHRHILEVDEYNILGLLATTSRIFAVEHTNIGNVLSYKLNLIYLCIFFFLSIFLFWKIDKKTLALTLKKYFSLTFFVPAVALFFLGLWLGYRGNFQNFNLDIFSFIAVICFIISIFSLSVITQYVRGFPEISEDNEASGYEAAAAQIMPWFVFFSLAGSLVVSSKFFLITLAYLLILYVFSSRSFNFFKFLPLAQEILFLAGSLLLLFSGFILGRNHQFLENFPWRIAAVVIFAFGLFFEMRKLNLLSFENTSRKETWAVNSKLILGILFFIFFLSSVFLLNEMRLFWWALFSGSVAFWTFNTRQKLFTRNAGWLIFLLTALFAAIMLKFLP